MSKEDCISHFDGRIDFSTICRYHVLLLGNVEELLQKLDPICFTNQQVDCSFTLFKYEFNGNIVAQGGQVFENVRRSICLNQRNSGGEGIPGIAKKRNLKKKYRKHFSSSFQNAKLKETGRSVFAEGTKQVEKTKYQREKNKKGRLFPRRLW